MHDDLETTIRATLERLHASIDDVPESWDSVVADAGSERRTRRAVPRFAVRLAVVGAAAAAIALGVLSVLPGEGPSAVERAEAALTASDGTILHTVAAITQTYPDGRVISHWSEAWQDSSPPYDQREVDGDGRRETATASGRPEVYLADTNTIYTLPENVALPERTKPGLDIGLQPIRDRMLDLLRSGEAHEDRRVTVNDREAIRIVSSDLKGALIVDADTYEPIVWTATADDGTVETIGFKRYEWLPATEANRALLSLAAQHPDAGVDRTQMTVEGFGADSKK
jgi:hypothetical protein